MLPGGLGLMARLEGYPIPFAIEAGLLYELLVPKKRNKICKQISTDSTNTLIPYNIPFPNYID